MPVPYYSYCCQSIHISAWASCHSRIRILYRCSPEVGQWWGSACCDIRFQLEQALWSSQSFCCWKCCFYEKWKEEFLHRIKFRECCKVKIPRMVCWVIAVRQAVVIFAVAICLTSFKGFFTSLNDFKKEISLVWCQLRLVIQSPRQIKVKLLF